MPKNKDKKELTPQTGERTDAQQVKTEASQIIGMLTDDISAADIAASGSYNTYREMRTNPTVALARTIAGVPVKVNQWTIGGKDEAPDEAKQLIQDNLSKLWAEMIENVLFALDYGWSPFEIIWDVDEETNKFVCKELKPLLVDKTKIQVDKKTGRFKGFKQEKVSLVEHKCFLYTYDGEAGYLYGRSRHENIRTTAYRDWEAARKRRLQYTKKVCGITPIIEYPVGQSYDNTGAKQENYDLAKKVLSHLGKGNGVCMPNVFAKYADDLTRSGADLTKLKAWKIDFLQSRGSYGNELNAIMKHDEVAMLRGWLVPERTAIEGQYGTKAESESHSKWVLMIADQLFEDIIRTVNRGLVDKLLLYNYGEKAMGSVWVERSGIDPELKKFLRQLISKVLGQPANLDLFMDWIDINRLMDNTGLPKAEEVVNERREERGLEPLDGEKTGWGENPGHLTNMVKGIYEQANKHIPAR